MNTYFPSWSAPTIFTAVADALEWIVKARGVRMLLDDYITVGAPAIGMSGQNGMSVPDL